MKAVPVEMIALKNIAINHHNRSSIDKAKIAKLAASMEGEGQLSPIAVHKNGKAKVELIAGERRVLAAKSLGWDKIEAKLFTGLTDVEIQQIRLVENLQRDDLTLIEEARQLAELKALSPQSRVEDLSILVGRSPEWVAGRIAVDKLLPSLRELITKLGWPIGHYILLARLPVESQTIVLPEIKANTSGKFPRWQEAPSYRAFDQWLNRSIHVLAAAPWDKDDAELLPAAGACSACPKRSSAEPLLFPEMADAKDDQCLDPACFERKQVALVQLSAKKLRDGGAEPIFFRDNYQELGKEALKTIGAKKTERTYDFVDCKKDDPKAVPAVSVEGQDAGKIKYVKPRGPVPNGRASNNRTRDQETGKPAEPSQKERLAALRAKRICRAVELWAERLDKLEPKFVRCVDMLLVFFGTNANRCQRTEGARTGEGGWAHFNKFGRGDLDVEAWKQLAPVFSARLYRFGPMEEQAKGLWAEAYAQAEALGLVDDLKVCWSDAVADVKQPKVLQDVPDDAALPIFSIAAFLAGSA